MKKITIIGFILGLLVVASLLFWHHLKHPSDAAIRQKLPGTWNITGNGGSGTTTIDSDGHFLSQFAGRDVLRLEGTWQVEDGCFVYRVTNSSLAPNRVPYTVSERIIRIDSQELVLYIDRERQEVLQKAEP